MTEVPDWPWRYKAEAEKITLKADASENVVIVTNNRDKARWLDGDCYAENNFGAVSSQSN